MKKKDLALGDLMNALIIIRRRNKKIDVRSETKAKKYFQKSIEISSNFNNHYHFATFLKDQHPESALNHLLTALTFIDDTDNEVYIDTLLDIANVRATLNRNMEALETYRAALNFLNTDVKISKGKKEIKLIVTLGNLGIQYGTLGQTKESRALYLQALEAVENHQVNGKKDLDHIYYDIMLNLGNLEFDLENLHTAKTYFEKVRNGYELKKRRYSNAGQMPISYYNDIGNFLLSIGDRTTAKKYYTDGLKEVKKISIFLPVEKAFYEAHLTHGLANLYRNTDTEKATDLYRETTQICKRFIDIGMKYFIPLLIGAMSDFANFLRRHNHISDAGNLYHEAMGLMLNNIDQSPKIIYRLLARMSTEYADVLIMNGNYRDAESMQLETLRFLFSATQANSNYLRPELARILGWTAAYLDKQGKLAQANDMYIKAIAEYEKIGDSLSVILTTHYIHTLIGKAFLNCDIDKVPDGYIAISKAEILCDTIRLRDPGEYMHYLSNIYVAKALLNLRSGKAPESEIEFQAAYDLRHKLMADFPGDHDIDLGPLLENWGQLHVHQQNWDRAIELLERAITFYKSKLLLNKAKFIPAIVNVLYNLATIYKYQGNGILRLEKSEEAIVLLLNNAVSITTCWRLLSDLYISCLNVHYQNGNGNECVGCLIRMRAIWKVFSGDMEQIKNIEGDLKLILKEYEITIENLQRKFNDEEIYLRGLISISYSRQAVN